MAGPRPRRALQPQPRRALQPRLVVRLARVAGPIVLIGVLGSGVAAAFWPRTEVTAAVPAPVVRTPEPSATTTTPSARSSRDAARRPAVTSLASKLSAKAPKQKLPTLRPFTTPTPSASKSIGQSASLKVTGVRYTTTSLKVRREPSVDAESITTLAAGSKVSVTTGSVSGWTAILYDQQRRWVSRDYLSTSKPEPASASSSSTSSGLSMAPCQSGSAVESGLTPDAIRVHRAVCARYPQITTYFGYRASDSGYHGSGRALDCMTSNSTLGWDIAYWLRANASRLGISEIIYSQRIWTVQRSSEGWRWMSDRGSATANHYDHVHVSVYGYLGSG